MVWDEALQGSARVGSEQERRGASPRFVFDVRTVEFIGDWLSS